MPPATSSWPASRAGSSSHFASTDTVARFAGECTLARLGGDEFTVLLAGVRNVGDARMIAERLVAAVSTPFELEGREVVVDDQRRCRHGGRALSAGGRYGA